MPCYGAFATTYDHAPVTQLVEHWDVMLEVVSLTAARSPVSQPLS